jgi:hypothetical protein
MSAAVRRIGCPRRDRKTGRSKVLKNGQKKTDEEWLSSGVHKWLSFKCPTRNLPPNGLRTATSDDNQPCQTREAMRAKNCAAQSRLLVPLNKDRSGFAASPSVPDEDK